MPTSLKLPLNARPAELNAALNEIPILENVSPIVSRNAEMYPELSEPRPGQETGTDLAEVP
jgi:hypothetical protein